MKPGVLILENGSAFEGEMFGYDSPAAGEVVFNTSLCGYQEILTDPSYYGQMIIMTYPLIGIYGTNNTDKESEKVQAAALIIGSYENEWSNSAGTDSLDYYLRKNNIPGICGIDTRALTKAVREHGAMKGYITDDGKILKKVRKESLRGSSGIRQGESSTLIKAFGDDVSSDLVPFVTTEKNYSQGHGKYKIAVMDYGIKRNILKELEKFDVTLDVYNAFTDTKEILNSKPDGIFLSNGPGDPKAVTYGISASQEFINSGIPVFGICLGHQLISLALGGDTYKLKFGHRGGNHPVKNLLTNKIEITSQNHGYAVDGNSLNNEDVEITHVNLYDGTNEGLKHRKQPVMSVQYHPESSPGPNDSKYLFEEFMEMVRKKKK